MALGNPVADAVGRFSVAIYSSERNRLRLGIVVFTSHLSCAIKGKRVGRIHTARATHCKAMFPARATISIFETLAPASFGGSHSQTIGVPEYCHQVDHTSPF